MFCLCVVILAAEADLYSLFTPVGHQFCVIASGALTLPFPPPLPYLAIYILISRHSSQLPKFQRLTEHEGRGVTLFSTAFPESQILFAFIFIGILFCRLSFKATFLINSLSNFRLHCLIINSMKHRMPFLFNSLYKYQSSSPPPPSYQFSHQITVLDQYIGLI